MKKLMVAAAIVCAAAFAQAGQINWSSTAYKGGELYNADGTTLVAQDTVVYLINAATLSQDSLLTNLRDAESASDYWASIAKSGDTYKILGENVVNSASKIAAKKTADLAESGTTISVYYAALVDDNVLISTQLDNIVVPGGSGQTVGASWSTAGDTFSKKNFGEGTYANTGAGWYSTVPEPTSGLLLLLGVAGLALRRRRA